METTKLKLRPIIQYSVLELCEQLWYPPPKSETVLGKQVAAAYRQAGLGEPDTGLKLIGGKYIRVKVYPPNLPTVEEAIANYYGCAPGDALED